MRIPNHKIFGAGMTVYGALALGIALRYNYERAHCKGKRE
jgi:hypothetical protein